MAVAGAPWQIECEKMEQRFLYLLTSGLWTDCIFIVGPETNQKAIQAHKLVLAMASPVFEAMFYGGLSEGNNPIPIPDVQPEAFRALLQYIYMCTINICSFDMAGNLWYVAKKYMLPHLEKECIKYISKVLSPRNACRAYEFACLYENKTLMDESMMIISTNTKEVLNDSSFEELELSTVITVCSLEHLDVDSELDLFRAVARYAEADSQRRLGQISPPVFGEPPAKKLCNRLEPPTSEEKELQSVSCSQASPTGEINSKPSTEVITSESTGDKDNIKEEPTIRAALQLIRFLSMTAQEFAEGPARSGLLTQDESFKVSMNITATDSPVAMPTGFSKCRERRSPRSDMRFMAANLDYTINALKCGNPSRVQPAASVAADVLSTPLYIQLALDKGILDALVPILTEGDIGCKKRAAHAIFALCRRGSPSQLSALAASAALEPYCRMLPTGDETRHMVLRGLTALLKKVEQNTKLGLLSKLREIGVPQLVRTALRDKYYDYGEYTRELANNLLQTYFSDGQ